MEPSGQSRKIEYGLLSNREAEVLRLLAQGKRAWEIGEILGIAKRTAEAHKQAIIAKLSVANCTQAVAVAVRDGFIKLD